MYMFRCTRAIVLICWCLQDGHHEIWEQEYVAGIIAAEVDRRDINTVSPSS